MPSQTEAKDFRWCTTDYTFNSFVWQCCGYNFISFGLAPISFLFNAILLMPHDTFCAFIRNHKHFLFFVLLILQKYIYLSFCFDISVFFFFLLPTLYYYYLNSFIFYITYFFDQLLSFDSLRDLAFASRSRCISPAISCHFSKFSVHISRSGFVSGIKRFNKV